MEKDFASEMQLDRPSSPSRCSITGPGMTFHAPQQKFTLLDFEVDGVYGVGSYSKVLKAKKKDTGDVYALKVMDKRFITKENKVACAKLERVVLDQLDHPGIVKLYFTFQDNYSLYMALESCDGGELFDQIARKGRLSEDDTRFYTAEIVDALEYMHGLGLIHRDIKPENLLLTAEGHIKIADFGSVLPTRDISITIPTNISLEKTGNFAGTAAYIPPELLNSAPVTYGIDLWALGCTLHHMLSGASPFKDNGEWLTFQKIVARDLIFPDYFSDAASDLIDKLLDMDPSKRLGAGPSGFAALKMHPFFKGINWRNIWEQPPPNITPELNASESNDAEDSISNWTDSPTQHGHDGSADTVSSSEAHSYTISSFDTKWKELLEPGEAIIIVSKLKKLRRLTSKKVKLILTDKGRLICVSTSKLMAKRKIIWPGPTGDINVHVANASHFKISTPYKIMSFEDAKGRAWQWKKVVEGLQKQ